MNSLLNALRQLRADVVASEEHDVAKPQMRLSAILLSQDELPEREKIARKYDNDMELITYTLLKENQRKATLDLIDDVVRLVERKHSGIG